MGLAAVYKACQVKPMLMPNGRLGKGLDSITNPCPEKLRLLERIICPPGHKLVIVVPRVYHGEQAIPAEYWLRL